MIAGVLDTSEQFIGGDNDTGEQLLLVTTTPTIKCFSFFASVVDTADKHSFANISANFRKNLKSSDWDTQWPGGH